MQNDQTCTEEVRPQVDLNRIEVRLLEEGELARFNALMEERHYLHSAHLVGEQMRYVAEYSGRWIGLLAWQAGSFSLKDREAWIGWSSQQKKNRLALVANNSRFLLLDEKPPPNLASKVLSLCTKRLSSDWEARYGHEVLIAETFVDSQLYKGRCYAASNWVPLGQTKGFRRQREDFYQEHDRPKQLWVKELRAGARTILRGKNLPTSLKYGEAPVCTHPPETLVQLFLFFGDLPDFRKSKGDYRVASLVAIAVCAMLSGVVRGQRDLAAFASNLTGKQCQALRLPRHGKPKRYRIPKETTFFRLLSQLEPGALEKALLSWQNHVVGPPLPANDWVAYDGKTLRHSQGAEIVSAVSVKTGHWLGSEIVQKKSNEIPAVQKLIRRIPMEHNVLLADAMHTQDKTAHQVVQEQGGDYLLTVKGNQKSVQENVQQLHQGLQNAFSPSGS